MERLLTQNVLAMFQTTKILLLYQSFIWNRVAFREDAHEDGVADSA
jgi:hypothetical protein